VIVRGWSSTPILLGTVLLLPYVQNFTNKLLWGQPPSNFYVRRELLHVLERKMQRVKEIEHRKQDYEVLGFGIAESLLSTAIAKDVFGRSIDKFLFCNCSEGEFG
jgi:hypothetical protein